MNAKMDALKLREKTCMGGGSPKVLGRRGHGGAKEVSLLEGHYENSPMTLQLSKQD